MRNILKSYYYLGKYLSVILFKVSFLGDAEIGHSLYLSPKGNIIIGVRKMGTGCTVQHNVTIGMGIENEPPIIGDDVWIGSNTIIFGKINVGSNSIISESTVISKNIPKRCLVGGNPGRILKRSIDIKP